MKLLDSTKTGPREYIHKTPSASVKFKNKFNFITDIIEIKSGLYKVIVYKWGAISLKNSKYTEYGYSPTESILTTKELLTYYDFDVTNI
jgi:hypothetical protein